MRLICHPNNQQTEQQSKEESEGELYGSGQLLHAFLLGRTVALFTPRRIAVLKVESTSQAHGKGGEMSTSGIAVLVSAVFLACAVEMVEALTIVLAVGKTRGWKSALEGTGAALALLAILVVIFGPSLIKIPLDTLRLVVGGVLLVFGMQWLRKAILRATGLKALHDEDAAYAEAVELAGSFSALIVRQVLAILSAAEIEHPLDLIAPIMRSSLETSLRKPGNPFDPDDYADEFREFGF